MKIELLEYPQERDWLAVKERALVTVGKKAVTPPTEEWKRKILEARHSPIRKLQFSFYLEIPYWVSVHLVRHIHAQPYVKSQRNDRQSDYDRNAARQDETVCMIWDMNAEELLTIANKRLCNQASKETREVVKEMCELVKAACPEFSEVLVPMCVYHGGVCHEMFSCREKVKNG
ncbi:MAG: FAD-dependent thymidylate synthase [Clostridia bacterium]|nr:FAD-dependent thymidylate synthase [Clostridia bacterium]